MPIQNNTFPQSGDPDDATRLAQLIGHSSLTDYVGSGLEITVDFESGSLTVSEGVFYTSLSQDDATSDGDTILDLGYVSQIEETTLDLPDSGDHYVFAHANVETTNSPSVGVESDSSEIPEDAVVIGELSVDGESVVEVNRKSEVFEQIQSDLEEHTSSTTNIHGVGDSEVASVGDIEDHRENSVHEQPQVPDTHGNDSHTETFAVNTDLINQKERIDQLRIDFALDGVGMEDAFYENFVDSENILDTGGINLVTGTDGYVEVDDFINIDETVTSSSNYSYEKHSKMDVSDLTVEMTGVDNVVDVSKSDQLTAGEEMDINIEGDHSTDLNLTIDDESPDFESAEIVDYDEPTNPSVGDIIYIHYQFSDERNPTRTSHSLRVYADPEDHEGEVEVDYWLTDGHETGSSATGDVLLSTETDSAVGVTGDAFPGGVGGDPGVDRKSEKWTIAIEVNKLENDWSKYELVDRGPALESENIDLDMDLSINNETQNVDSDSDLTFDNLEIGSYNLETSGEGTVDLVAEWQEVKEGSNNPSVSINNETADYDGTLSDGETVSLDVDESWIESGSNTISVELDDPSEGPEMKVGAMIKATTEKGVVELDTFDTDYPIAEMIGSISIEEGDPEDVNIVVEDEDENVFTIDNTNIDSFVQPDFTEQNANLTLELLNYGPQLTEVSLFTNDTVEQ